MNWLSTLFEWHWPPTTAEWTTLLVLAGILGWARGTIQSERRNQKWVEEHTKELEDLKAQLTAVGKQNR